MHVAQPPPRTVAAVEFAIDAYTGVKVRPGKGLPHAEAVALDKAGGLARGGTLDRKSVV